MTRCMANSLLLILLAGLTGCGSNAPDTALFTRAEQLCLEQQWAEAQPVLREFLLQSPHHAGAHFYLGRAYMLGPDFRPAVAEGELQLALRLYEASGKTSPIERFGDDYFEIICNLESMKVLLKAIALESEEMMSVGLPPGIRPELVERMRGYVDRAAAVQPDFKDVVDAKRILRSIEQAMGMDSPPAEEDIAPAIA